MILSGINYIMITVIWSAETYIYIYIAHCWSLFGFANKNFQNMTQRYDLDNRPVPMNVCKVQHRRKLMYFSTLI